MATLAFSLPASWCQLAGASEEPRSESRVNKNSVWGSTVYFVGPEGAGVWASLLVLGPEELDCESPQDGHEGQHREDHARHPDARVLGPPLGRGLGGEEAGEVEHVAQRPAQVGAVSLWDKGCSGLRGHVRSACLRLAVHGGMCHLRPELDADPGLLAEAEAV